MNFDDTPLEAAFRAEARAWIETNAPGYLREDLLRAPSGRFQLRGRDILKELRAWLAKKAAAGWSCIHWPREYGGRGATPIERVIWRQEEGVYDKLNALFTVGIGMCAPTLMTYATDDQKRRYIPRIASGEDIWCQLFSEPAAGSDVAGLLTRAERDGDSWIVNGQKIWTTGAHYSRYGLLLTRTDSTVPKHKGLTMFFIDMETPGVEVRPIKQMNGNSDFNEVYFSDVRVPDSHRLGEVGSGWSVSLTTLMNERLTIGAAAQTGFAELLAFCSRNEGDHGLLVDDPAIRSRLAQWAVRDRGLKYTGYRSISALSRGERPGPENSIGKLVAGVMQQEIAAFAMDLQASSGAIFGEAEGEDQFQRMLFRAPAARIAGGTDEILRNVIAERVLGLPPDVRVDKDVPFNKIARAKGK